MNQKRRVFLVGFVAIGLIGGLFVLSRSDTFKNRWYEGGALATEGTIADLVVGRNRIFTLSESGAPVVHVDELATDGKSVRRAEIGVRLRPWRAKPKRPNLLMRNKGYLVFYAWDVTQGGTNGFGFVDESSFAYGFAPKGPMEEVAEGTDCVFTEVVEKVKRSLYCFDTVTKTYRVLPQVDPGQDVQSLIPTKDGGTYALLRVGATQRWYRFLAGAWTVAGPDVPLASTGYLADWSGGRAMIRLPDSSIGDLRSVAGQTVINNFRNTESSFGSKAIPDRVVLAEINGKLITQGNGNTAIATANP